MRLIVLSAKKSDADQSQFCWETIVKTPPPSKTNDYIMDNDILTFWNKELGLQP